MAGVKRTGYVPQLDAYIEDLDPELYLLRRSSRTKAAPIAAQKYQNSSSLSDSEAESSDISSLSDRTEDDDDSEIGEDSDYGSKKKKGKRPQSKKSAPVHIPAKRTTTRRRFTITSSEDEHDEESSRSSPSSDNVVSAVRFSTRSYAVKTYNEDANYEELGLSTDEEYHTEEKTSNAKPSGEIVEEYENIIESIHDRRLIDEDATEEKPITEVYEFLVKWKGHSHLHDTWESYDDLRDFKGFKKVDNYIKSLIIEKQLRKDPTVSREEIEDCDVNAQLERGLYKDFKVVERIISVRRNSESEYLCKWKRLPYKDCTWEKSSAIEDEFQDKIDQYLDRHQSTMVPWKSKNFTRNNPRPEFKKMDVQPAYLKGGELRDYQLHGLNWMAFLWSKNDNGILADEMGLGKTVQTISIISYLFHTMNQYGPYLVVVPLSTIGSWQREFEKWAPDLNVVCYIGDNRSRHVAREYEFYHDGNKGRPKFNVLLTTYELVLKDRSELGAMKWTYLAVDEAHRLKNSQSQLHEALKDFSTQNRLLITGTPLQNTIQELYALIHFLMPDKFPLEADWELTQLTDSPDQAEKISALHSQLKPYMLRRLKKDVETSMPGKTERILRVELSIMQMMYYKSILTKNFAVLNKNVTGSRQLSLLNICVELKKASNHPFLFQNAETETDSREAQLEGLIKSSGKMVLLNKLMMRLRQDGHRVLIFSQMVRMLDILTDYMKLKGYPHQRLDGSVGSEARKKSIEHFNAPGSPDFAFLLSTRAGGLGINLETADTVIIFDSDWNPQNDLQAMARAHRIGQTKTVNVYRLVSKDTIEEDIIERCKNKMVLEHLVIKQMDTSGMSIVEQKTGKAKVEKNNSTGFTKDELNAIIKFGAQNMFKDQDNQRKSILDDLDLDDILARAEHTDTTMAEVGSDGGAQFLEQFQVADYGGGNNVSWEDIIPESERQKLEEMERTQEQLDLWASSRRRTVVSYADDGRFSQENPEKNEDSTKKKKRRQKKTKKTEKSDGPITEKDIRALIRSTLRYGSIKQRYDEIVVDTELEGKDKDKILGLVDELKKECFTAVEERNKADEASAGTEADRKSKNRATLITFRDVPKVNAGLIVQRIIDLRLLSKRLAGVNLSNFRLNLDIKSVHAWSVTWGQKEDSMLLVGVYKHGFGNWHKICDDKTLGLDGKMFLSGSGGDNADEDEPDDGNNKMIPRALHLGRRADYLLKILREFEQETKVKVGSESVPNRRGVSSKDAKAAANGITTNKRQQNSTLRTAMETSTSRPKKKDEKGYENGDAAGPSSSRKRGPVRRKDTERSREDGGTRKHQRSSRRTPSESRTESGAESVDDETVGRCKELLRPVKKSLQQLKNRVETSSNQEKIALVKEHLGSIGNRIVEILSTTPSHKREELKKNLWEFVFFYWPHQKTASAERVAAMYEKIVQGSKNQEQSPQIPEDQRQDRGRSPSPRRSETKRRCSPTPHREPERDRERDHDRKRQRDYDRDYERDHDRDEKRRRPNTSRPDPIPYTHRKRRWEDDEDERRVRRG